jgi:orotate phosphoribosyltransferase
VSIVTFEAVGLAGLVKAREGHFRFESGHHGSLWLDLDALFLRPSVVAPYARQLAERIAHYSVDVVCGPWSGGAFLAQMIAEQLDLSFVYSQPTGDTSASQLYTRAYSIPTAFEPHLDGKRIAVVDDVINAGSAVTATLVALTAVKAHSVVVASLMTLGQAGRQRITERGPVVETLETRNHQIWPAGQCPMCASNLPLES